MSGRLTGKRIVVTRAIDQASQLAELLQAEGAVPVLVPVLTFGEPTDGGAALSVAAEAARAGDYDWVVITSANAAERWTAVCPAPWSPRPMIAAIGAATAAKLPRVDLVPRRNLSEGLVEDFPPGPGRVLIPRAAVARDVAPVGLRAKGWSVDVVEAYRTVPARPDHALLVEAKNAHAIAFTSASTVTNYLAAAGRDALPPVVVCIGPATADRARHERVTVDRVADPHTLLGMMSALVHALAPTDSAEIAPAEFTGAGPPRTNPDPDKSDPDRSGLGEDGTGASLRPR